MDALGPGQVAYIRAGTYNEGGRANSLWWTRSGSASKPIAIRGYPGESKRVILTARVKLEGDYLRLADLVIERNRAYSDFDDAYTGDVSVWLAGDHDVLNHVEVRNSNMSGVLTSGDADSVLASFIHDNGRHWNLDHGIYLGGSHQYVANNVIEGNLAYGVHIWPACDACIVTSNTLVHNHRSGLLVGGDTSGTRIVNNISAFNSEYGFRLFELSGQDNESLNNLAYRNASGGYCSDECGGGMTVVYELNADPMFVSNTRDFHLRRRSPAIDAGLGSYAPKTDFSGRPRPKGAAPDLGAYERQDR